MVLSRRTALAILGALAASPRRAGAQTPARVPLVGVLSVGLSTMPSAAPARDALERGLRELRWTPGETVRLDFRYAEGKPERLDGLATQLVRAGPDVIVARATASIRAARQATSTIPIVMSGAGIDPVQGGFVASYARPGGNITGLTLLSQELLVKQLQLLKELVPRLTRVTVLGSRAAPLLPQVGRDLQAAAERLDIELRHVDLTAASELDEAFAASARAGAGGVVLRADPYILETNARQVVGLALKHRLPAAYWLDTYSHAGGLLSYGADLLEVHRRAAYYVDRLLRGARPGDLPIEEPSTFALVVNTKTARAIGLAFPASVLARASEVIQ